MSHGGGASGPTERSVRLPGGGAARVWEKGEGEPLGYLAGLRGLPRWIPFLDRLAERRRVVAPSLPGFAGGSEHRDLDDLADWLAATLDLLEAAELDGADLVGASIGATLAAEVAAFSHATVRRLALIAPFGLFDEAEPVADVWAQRRSQLGPLLCEQPDRLEALLAAPEGADATEWEIVASRTQEAGARLLWPTGDLGLAKRLHRIQAPTLLVWGSRDRVVPASYAKRFAAGVGGWVEIRSIEGAGHMAELDRAEDVADAILGFVG